MHSGPAPITARPARLTPWDRLVGRRTAVFFALVFALAVLVTAASDEGGVSLTVRAARTLPALPLAGAVAALLTLAPLRRRGDVRALGAAGLGPWRIVRSAVFACAAPHIVVAVFVVVSPRAEVSAFFPRAPTLDRAVPMGETFVDVRRGVTIHADGTLEQAPRAAGVPSDDAGTPRGGRAAIAVLLVLAGVALPLACVVARRKDALRLALAALAAVAATVLALHLAAAGRLHPLAAALPWAALLALVALRYRSLRWT